MHAVVDVCLCALDSSSEEPDVSADGAPLINGIIELAVQCCGGNGIAKDLPIACFYEHVRPFRIFDGADEVHRRTIARNAFEDVKTEEVEHVLRFDEPRRAQTAADD